jgi:hypothetical protein
MVRVRMLLTRSARTEQGERVVAIFGSMSPSWKPVAGSTAPFTQMPL